MKTLIFLFMMLLCGAACSSESDLERLQSAFIQKIINYVEWPSRNSAVFFICVAENEKLYELMKESMDGKVTSGKVIRVVRFDKEHEVDDMDIIISREAGPFSLYRLDGVLVITDDPSGLHGKSILNFVLENDRLRFDIDQAQAVERKLKINSRLLKLARELR